VQSKAGYGSGGVIEFIILINYAEVKKVGAF
jgi:hypothetical protein